MKYALAFLPAHICYWLGHAISLVMHSLDAGCLYRPYNRLMLLSCDISDWGNVGLWKAPQDAQEGS